MDKHGKKDNAVKPGFTRLILSVSPGGALLIGDAVVVCRSPVSVVIYAPESTKVMRGDAFRIRDPERLQEIAAAQLTGPYRVDGVPGYIRDFADAAQAAELNHRDGVVCCVRDKYDNEVYRSQGGPS